MTITVRTAACSIGQAPPFAPIVAPLRRAGMPPVRARCIGRLAPCARTGTGRICRANRPSTARLPAPSRTRQDAGGSQPDPRGISHTGVDPRTCTMAMLRCSIGRRRLDLSLGRAGPQQDAFGGAEQGPFRPDDAAGHAFVPDRCTRQERGQCMKPFRPSRHTSPDTNRNKLTADGKTSGTIPETKASLPALTFDMHTRTRD